jgi:hypothetical protein
MQNDQTEVDRQVLAALRAPTLSGAPAVIAPKRLSHHIGHFITDTGWGHDSAGRHRVASPTRGARPRGTRRSSPHLDDHSQQARRSIERDYCLPAVSRARRRLTSDRAA